MSSFLRRFLIFFCIFFAAPKHLHIFIQKKLVLSVNFIFFLSLFIFVLFILLVCVSVYTNFYFLFIHFILYTVVFSMDLVADSNKDDDDASRSASAPQNTCIIRCLYGMIRMVMMVRHCIVLCLFFCVIVLIYCRMF